MPQFVVMTGDIVDSSSHPFERIDATLYLVSTAARDISGWQTNPEMTSGFARRGGDGWQMVLDAPALALRASLYVLACLRASDPAVESRIAVAVGDGTLPGSDPNFAHGPAFTASGRALSRIDRHARLIHAEGGAAGAAFRLADEIAQGKFGDPNPQPGLGWKKK